MFEVSFSIRRHQSLKEAIAITAQNFKFNV
jgi:hypothetical protein